MTTTALVVGGWVLGWLYLARFILRIDLEADGSVSGTDLAGAVFIGGAMAPIAPLIFVGRLVNAGVGRITTWDELAMRAAGSAKETKDQRIARLEARTKELEREAGFG